MIKAEELTLVLEGEHPAGQNLEYDPLYLEMDALAVEVPDSFIGESKAQGRDADWKKLSKNCLELWKKTRDLRVATYLVIAEAITGGLAGLVAGLKVPVFLVKELWDSFYPQLDPEYDDDPLERLNILSMLSPQEGSINDPVMFIPRFREVRLVPSLKYTLRDLLISLNELEVRDDKAIDPRLLRAELMNVGLAEIEGQAALVREGQALIAELCETMNSKMKGYVLDMSALSHELNRLHTFYKTHLESLTSPSEEVPEGTSDSGVPYTAPAREEKISLLSYHAATRAEALLLLKKGAEYFQSQEPNSPIPHLINRALRFSEMSFIELLEDIVPDALSRGRDILGIKPE
ncbi:MAG: type VI secretion system ImpA family N-terminal domain-containing protein [Treponema sp.]|jgi:type VI secretion system ImpA family protein|nr:type VI secretion system ImpA family N-terminal domain-containing protein [Treponema sp.]